MSEAFFPARPALKPMIYAYTENNPTYRGFLKDDGTAFNQDHEIRAALPLPFGYAVPCAQFGRVH